MSNEPIDVDEGLDEILWDLDTKVTDEVKDLVRRWRDQQVADALAKVVGHRIMSRNREGKTGCRGCTWVGAATPGTDAAWAEFIQHVAALPATEEEADG